MFRTVFLIHVFALLNVCTCLENEKEVKISKTEQLYLKYKRRHSNASELIALGEKLCRERKYKEAILAFSDVIKMHKVNNMDVYLGRGKCFLQMGKINYAISDFKHAASLETQPGECRRLLANTLFKSGNYTEAISHMSYLSPADIVELADKLCSKNEFEKAMDVYEKLIVIYPSETKYYTKRGNCHVKMGNTNEALSDFERAADLDKNLPKKLNPGYSRVLLCLALFDNGRIDKDVLSTLTEAQFKDLACKLVDRNRLTDSVDCLCVAIKKYPMNTGFYMGRAFLSWTKKDYDSAISDYKKAIELEPSTQNFNTWLRLIEVLVDLRDFEGAKQNLEIFESSVPKIILKLANQRLREIRLKLHMNMQNTQ